MKLDFSCLNAFDRGTEQLKFRPGFWVFEIPTVLLEQSRKGRPVNNDGLGLFQLNLDTLHSRPIRRNRLYENLGIVESERI